MIKTIAPQYLNQNAGRRYPLADDAETVFRFDDTTNIVIPDNAILDFRCMLHDVRITGAPVATLTRIGSETVEGVFYKWVDVTLSCDDDTVTVLRFRVPGSMAAEAPYTAYAENDVASGTLVVTRAIQSVHWGDVSVPFARTTVSVASLRVDSIQSSYSVFPGKTAEITGDVILTDGKNAEPYLDGNSLHLDIFKGAGLGEECQSTSQDQKCDNVMFTVNGERPGSSGELKITGAGGITIRPLPEQHTIEIGLSDVTVDTMDVQCEAACGKREGV